MASKSSTTFKLNQRIVYPMQGVGHIQSIEERKFSADKTYLYYIIYLEVSDMTVMVPVDNAEALGIRAIVSAAAANKALDVIEEESEAAPTDWKMRYAMNQDLLKKGDVTDTALVVRTLYHRSKLKELPIMERKLYDSAKKLLVDEVSLALGVTKPEVEKLIHARLEADSDKVVKENVRIVDEDDLDDEFDGVDEQPTSTGGGEEEEESLETLAEEEANQNDDDEEE